MLQLGSFFAAPHLLRDAAVRQALPPGADLPGSVCYAMDEAGVKKANANANVVAVIAPAFLCDGVAPEKGCVQSPWPQRCFYEFHNALCLAGACELRHEHFIDPSAAIAASASLGRHLFIGAGVRIGAHAVIEDYTCIGAGTRIGAQAVIGGGGLQDTIVDGRNILVEFAGGVQIGERCEILSGALIQRPYLCGYTLIGDDCKLGPGASVGHSVKVGRASIIGARSVVAGNCQVGGAVWIGAGAVISDAISIGDGARVQLGSVVVRHVGAGEVVSGNFALPHAKHLRFHTRQRHEP